MPVAPSPNPVRQLPNQMAGILEISETLSALTQITATVSQSSYFYVSAVKNAPEGAIKLSEELSTLVTALGSIAEVSDRCISTINQMKSYSDLMKVAPTYTEYMESLGTTINQTRKGKSLKLAERSKWPFRASETAEMLVQLGKYKSLFWLALTAGQVLGPKALEVFCKKTDILVAQIGASVQVQNEGQITRRHRKKAILLDDVRRELIIAWLYPIDMDIRHNNIQQKRQPDTGLWLLNDPTFESWANGRGSPALWGYGIPGAGKTFISSAVIDVLERRLTKIAKSALAYLYFNYQDQPKPSPIMIIRCLIRQLLATAKRKSLRAVKSRHRICNRYPMDDDPNIPESLRSLHERYQSMDCSPSLTELKDVLKDVLERHSSIFFIFDGADERDGDGQWKDIFPVIKWLVAQGGRVFLSTRQNTMLSFAFTPDIGVLFEFIKLFAPDTDLRPYIESTIKAHVFANRMVSGDIRKFIVAKLLKACKGVFLLARLQLKFLCLQTTVNQIHEAILDFERITGTSPSNSLTWLYEKFLHRIMSRPPHRRQMAFKAFSWLVKSKFIMKADELLSALSPTKDADDIPTKEVLLEVCEGLVEIEEGSDCIQLVHSSFKEYLEQLPVSDGWIDMNLEILQGCVQYLTQGDGLDSERDNPGELFNCSLGQYVRSHLSVHTQECGQNSCTDLLLSFIQNPRSSLIHRCNSKTCSDFMKDPFNVACYLGHTPSIQMFATPDRPISNNFMVSPHPTALYIVSAAGNAEAIQILLDAGHQVNERMELCDTNESPTIVTALHGAVKNRQVMAAKALLQSGADMHAKTPVIGQSPVSLSFESPYKPLLELFLMQSQRAKNPTNQGAEEPILLHLALQHENGDPEAAEILLDLGSDPQERDGLGRTAIFYALERWSTYELVSKLIEKGARVDITDNNRRTPLHHMCSNNKNLKARNETARSRRMDNFGLGRMGVKAPHGASDSGCSEPKIFWPSWKDPLEICRSCIRTMLAAGADSNAEDVDGMTPLYLAAISAKPMLVTAIRTCQGDLRSFRMPVTTSHRYLRGS